MVGYMKYNAYILSRIMNNYSNLLEELGAKNFDIQKDHNGDVRAAVVFSRYEEFAKIVQEHLNAPYNYVDISFPKEKRVVIVFGAKIFVISNQEEMEKAKKWAIELGLPPAQADLKLGFI